MENFETNFDTIANSPEKEKYGSNVEIVLKFIRHGERDKENNLTDIGREITHQKAQESGIIKTDFDAVKAIGSNVGPKSKIGMGRSLETAHIYAHEIARDEAFNTRRQDILNYETLVSKPPYDHKGIYDSNLPENYNELSDEEKIKASKKAQEATVNYLVSLNTPEAHAYKDEVAGSFAYIVDHYIRMAKHLKSDSRVLIPAGTHGGTMEFLLQKALVHEDADGNKAIGFNKLSEIGGEFSPSDSYNVNIKTNEQGDLERRTVI